MHPYFEISIPAYSLFAIIGLFTMMMIDYFRYDDKVLSFVEYMILIGFMIIGVGCGSKLLFIVTRIPEIINDFTWKKTIHIIITSGFVFYGGLMGAISGAYIFAIKYKKSPYYILNLVAPGFAAFHVWGRIGCFFGGCCYGKAASWGVALYNEPGILRIPIQLIESACIFCIFLILLAIEKKGNRQASLIEVYLFLYAVCRFVLEFFRGDEIRGIWGGISTSQWISILLLVGIIFKAIYTHGRHRLCSDAGA